MAMLDPNTLIGSDVDLSSYTGAVGEGVGIVAVDDFEVLFVCLALTDINWELIEGGAAVPELPLRTFLRVTLATLRSPRTIAHQSFPTFPPSELRE